MMLTCLRQEKRESRLGKMQCIVMMQQLDSDWMMKYQIMSILFKMTNFRAHSFL